MIKEHLKSKYTVAGVVVFILAISSALIYALNEDAPVPFDRPSLYRVKPLDFTIEVKMLGVLDASKSHMVSSAIKGDRGKIIFLIDDGMWVDKDTVLVRLDPTPFEEEVQRLQGEANGLAAAMEAQTQIMEWEKNELVRATSTAEYNFTVAQLEARRLDEGEGPLQLAQYESEMEKAQVEYKRYENYLKDLHDLKNEGFDNPVEINRAQENAVAAKEKFANAKRRHDGYKLYVLPSLLKAAQAKIENAKLLIEQTKRGGAFKIANSVADLNQVRSKHKNRLNALAVARQQLAQTVIRAPLSGIVIHYETFRNGQKRKPRVGDTVWQNQPLLYVPDISSLIVKTATREVDLHKIALEQPATIQVDAYPDSQFNGRVAFIGALATERIAGHGGDKYFQLTIALEGRDMRLRPGMTAHVAIHADEARNVLAIPVQAVFSQGRQRFCYVLKDAQLIKTTVKTGKQNEDFIEILNGLAAGNQVSLMRPASEAPRS